MLKLKASNSNVSFIFDINERLKGTKFKLVHHTIGANSEYFGEYMDGYTLETPSRRFFLSTRGPVARRIVNALVKGKITVAELPKAIRVLNVHNRSLGTKSENKQAIRFMSRTKIFVPVQSNKAEILIAKETRAVKVHKPARVLAKRKVKAVAKRRTVKAVAKSGRRSLSMRLGA